MYEYLASISSPKKLVVSWLVTMIIAAAAAAAAAASLSTMEMILCTLAIFGSFVQLASDSAATVLFS